MKKNLFYLLFVMSLFISCGDDQEEDYTPKAYPKGTKQWGYFEGYIDNEYVNVSNKSYTLGRSPVFSIRQIIDASSTIEKDSINYISTQIKLSEGTALGIAIFKFTPKIRYSSVTPLINSNEGYINALLKDKDNNIQSYIPKENNPFKIEIINVDWESYFDPIVEVKISGYLFNRSNLNDSVAIDGSYGTR